MERKPLLRQTDWPPPRSLSAPPGLENRSEHRRPCYHTYDDHQQSQIPEQCRQESRPEYGHEGNGKNSTQEPSADDGKSQGVSDEVLKDQKRRMAIITTVAFFVSCAGKLHEPLIIQYIYQTYTVQLYGNASHGVHVSRQPCLNTSSLNSSFDSLRDEVQDKSADLTKNLELLSGGIAVVANLFLGTYSDVLGRRFSLFISIFGHFLRNVSAPIIIYWDLGLPALYVGYALDGLCGGSYGIVMAYYVYTVDITRGEKQRTLGLAVIGAVTNLATAGLEIGVGIFIENTGFFYPSLAASALLLVCIFIIAVFLPETVTRNRKRWADAPSPLQAAKRMMGIFVLRDHPYQTGFILLGLLSIFVITFMEIGVEKVDSLYIMAEPFCMSAFTSGVRKAVYYVAQELAGITFIKILQNRISTQGLAIIGSLSLVAKEVTLALASTVTVVYISSGAGLFGSMIYPAIRGMMSRMVPSDRAGTLFAWIAVVESVCQSSSEMAFNPLYEATLTFMPGFAFLLGAGFVGILILIQILYIYLLSRSQRKQFNSVSVQTESTVEWQPN